MNTGSEDLVKVEELNDLKESEILDGAADLEKLIEPIDTEELTASEFALALENLSVLMVIVELESSEETEKLDKLNETEEILGTAELV